MANPAEVKRALSVQLDRTKMESRSAAKQHAVADTLQGVLRKATRHLEHNKPLHTLNVNIGTRKMDEQPLENVPTLVARSLSDDLSRLTETDSSSESTYYVFESTIPGIYIRSVVYHPLLGIPRTTFALVGKKSA